MNANPAPVLAIFEKKMRLEVPLFQRQYVWSRDQQWEPLWEDIERKFGEYLEGRKDAPVHFLGAMVLDQRQTPTTHVEKRQVIDGQQRLATLQIFLAAFRDLCQQNGFQELAAECESFTQNKGMMAEPSVDKFKVWPTQLDRPQFSDVMTSGSRAELENRHPLTRRKYARKPNPRPRMVEAYLFFYDRLEEFFIGTSSDPPFAGHELLAARFEECLQALRNSLQVVVIDLEQSDDPQVIFETLNARGAPLLPADLLRNFVFLRAARQGESQEALYDQYWRGFDDPFWRQEVRQGRLIRPRSDLYMQHFLASRQGVDVPIRHLFVEYKFWIERHRPFPTVRDELDALARQGNDFRRILEPKKGDVLFAIATFLEGFDIRTAYPLLLYLMDAGLSDAQWRVVSQILESYLLRRTVCNFTTKGYNRVFLTLVRALRTEGTSSDNVARYLRDLSGESVEWPSDQTFREAWQSRHAYQILRNHEIIHILRRLNETFLSQLSERISIDSPLTVEHILPQSWVQHWPLPDGSKGLTAEELWASQEDDVAAEATRRRNAALQTLGNLTILTQPLNSSVSNSGWTAKKTALLSASLLPINQQLHDFDSWNETTIEVRSNILFERALKVWPGPQAVFDA